MHRPFNRFAFAYLTSHFNVWANVRSHWITVGMTFSLVLFITASLIPRSGVAADRDAESLPANS